MSDELLTVALSGIVYHCDWVSIAIGEGCGECDGCQAYAAIHFLARRLAETREALAVIASHGCERLVPPYNCDGQPEWTPDARYGADRVCDPCIARRALVVSPADTTEAG